MIPLAKDTRECVGDFADKVENRSLLFDKMVLAKNWGHPDRFNDANRFNVLRASTDGSGILAEDRDAAQRSANSDRASEENRIAAQYKADVAGALAGSVTQQNALLLQTRSRHSNHLLALLEKSYAGRIHTFVGQLKSRLLINMAGGIMENAGLALDRCFGLPYIPGSAIKGVARNVALWEIKQTEDPTQKLAMLRTALLAFGFTGNDLGDRGDFSKFAGTELVSKVKATLPRADEFKGICSFLPAYPSSDENLNIVAECMTPHPSASESASGRGNPRPLFYPAVEAGSSFAFAVLCQRSIPEEFLDSDSHVAVLSQATEWVQQAIQEAGIGAKTGAGYGWFGIDAAAEEKRREEARIQQEKDEADRLRKIEEAKQKEAEIERMKSLSPLQIKAEEIKKDHMNNSKEFIDLVKDLDEKDDFDQQAFFVFFLEENDTMKKLRKDWRRNNKPKGIKRWKMITEVAQKLEIKLP